MCSNQKIRDAIASSGLKHWQVAAGIGVSSWHFSVMLRQELPAEKQQMILNTIKRLSEKQED